MRCMLRFEMFTEDEAEIFALHINFQFYANFSFKFVCSTQIKMHQESSFWGAFFWYCVLQNRWSFQGLRLLGPPQGLCPGPTGGLQHPRPPAARGNDLWSLHIVPSAGYHFHLCPHDKFGPPLKFP